MVSSFPYYTFRERWRDTLMRVPEYVLRYHSISKDFQHLPESQLRAALYDKYGMDHVDTVSNKLRWALIREYGPMPMDWVATP